VWGEVGGTRWNQRARGRKESKKRRRGRQKAQTYKEAGGKVWTKKKAESRVDRVIGERVGGAGSQRRRGREKDGPPGKGRTTEKRVGNRQLGRLVNEGENGEATEKASERAETRALGGLGRVGKGRNGGEGVTEERRKGEERRQGGKRM